MIKMHDLSIHPMLNKYDYEILHWKYEGVYAFYNRTGEIQLPDKPEEIIENSFVALNETGELIGHFHFGSAGRIPTVENFNYTDEYLDMGLGMRPDVCGLGMGADFIKQGTEFAEQKYNMKKLRLSVAVFNERAIKAYKKAGFVKICEVTNAYFMNRFWIMIKE